MLRTILSVFRKKAASNALWIVICKGIQAVIGLVISMISARLLGPADYGLLNYAASLVLFVTPIAQLGFTATLVQELVARPEREGEILGTSICATLVSSALCILGIALFVSIANPDEPGTMLVCLLYSLLLIAQSAELIQYWFQAKLMSRYTAVVTLAAYAIVAVYQFVVLISRLGVKWFAVSKAIEYAMIAAALLIVYRRNEGLRLSFSLSTFRHMIGRSWHYMLANLMVMTYAQTDRIMIKNMIGDAAMGYYSAAVFCANITDFVFFAIIDSARPVILEAKLQDERKYENSMSLLYSIIIYFSLFQSIIIAIAAKPVVYLLYGAEYGPAVGVLRLIIWYTAFSYIGSARSIWILAEGKQNLLWKINLFGALVNIALNIVLIPYWGIEGAAFASLITQMFNNVGIGFFMPSIRKNNELIMRGMKPGTVFRYIQKLR